MALKTPKPRTISKAKYYQLVGLIAAAKKQQEIMDAMVEAARDITQEVDSEGNPERSGHTMDMLWGSRPLDEGLRILKIRVAK